MPGIVDIIADVAADPTVDSAVEKLVSGLFGHFKDLLATGNTAAVEQAVNDGIQAVPDMVAAVTANTQTPAGDAGA
jgi:hypothetical protein